MFLKHILFVEFSLYASKIWNTVMDYENSLEGSKVLICNINIWYFVEMILQRGVSVG